MLRLSDARGRRHEPNIIVVHYNHLSADLDGQMRRLTEWLGIAVPQEHWPSLVRAATFERMRAGADRMRWACSRTAPHSSDGGVSCTGPIAA
jgi:hypothetical protein